MKLPLLTASFLAFTLTLAAQITVTDSFSGVSSYWEPDSSSNGGVFTVSGGVLNFSHSGVLTGTSASVSRDWSNSLSAASDWSARVDLTLNASSLVAGQVMQWNFYAAALTSASPDDYLVATITQSYMLHPTRTVIGTIYTDNASGTFGQDNSITSPTISLLFSYNAATTTLTLSRDGDNNPGTDSFTSLISVNTATTWSVGASDDFGLRLVATDLANAGAASALSSGIVYADNFSTTSSAIPEPSTYALAFGVLALLAVGARKRIAS